MSEKPLLDSANQEENAVLQQNYRSQPPATKATILLVDDEKELVELGQLILSHYGYQVATCVSAIEALECLEKNTFDLVISDVVMPGMSGYELSTEIMKRFPDTKIQLVSGYSEDQQMSADHQQLQRQLIRKPYKSSTLLHRVNELLS